MTMNTAAMSEQAKPDFEMHAMVRIFTGELAPEHLTQSIGMFPSRVTRKGEEQRQSSTDSWVFSTSPKFAANQWILDSGEAPANAPLEDMVDGLLSRFDGKEPVLRNWTKDAYLTIAAYGYKHMPPITLRPEQLERLASLGLTLDVDLHDLTEAQDNEEVEARGDK